MMKSPYFADSVLGYNKYINSESFADFILLNELVKNIDAYRLSTFFYKDRDSRNPKMFAGSVWDFNLAFGNADYYEAYTTNGWVLEYVSDFSNMPDWENFYIPFWWKKLFTENKFRNIIHNRWVELRNSVWSNQNLMNIIDSLVLYLDESQQRNFQRWPILGQWIWPNHFVGQTYQEEIDYLKNWLVERLNWLDQNMVGDPSSVEQTYQLSGFFLEQNYPNPFNPTTKIRYSIPCSTDNYSVLQNVTLKIYDILGTEVATLVNEYKSAGVYEVEFNIHSNEGKYFSSGVYFYKLQVGSFYESKKMTVIK